MCVPAAVLAAEARSLADVGRCQHEIDPIGAIGKSAAADGVGNHGLHAGVAQPLSLRVAVCRRICDRDVPTHVLSTISVSSVDFEVAGIANAAASAEKGVDQVYGRLAVGWFRTIDPVSVPDEVHIDRVS